LQKPGYPGFRYRFIPPERLTAAPPIPCRRQGRALLAHSIIDEFCANKTRSIPPGMQLYLAASQGIVAFSVCILQKPKKNTIHSVLT